MAEFSKNMELIASQNLDLAPSCIEFVPGADGYFIVGTYNLQNNVPQETDNSGKTAVSQVYRVPYPDAAASKKSVLMFLRHSY